MSWKEERDALIAQTLAFVQSVTGKRDPFDKPDFDLAPPAAQPNAEPVQPQASQVAPAPIERSASKSAVPAERDVPRSPPAPAEVAAEIPTSIADSTQERAALPERAAPARSPAPSDVAAEIRARIESFRAHQQRFNRERDEYFAATLARLRAAMKDTPPPRLGK